MFKKLSVLEPLGVAMRRLLFGGASGSCWMLLSSGLWLTGKVLNAIVYFVLWKRPSAAFLKSCAHLSRGGFGSFQCQQMKERALEGNLGIWNFDTRGKLEHSSL